MGRKKKDSNEPADDFASIIDGLKKLYKDKILPLEKLYQFEDFHTHLLTDAEFESKPTILLLGQYSVGKTTFIKYLLGRDFPGQHIGPEPTTDRFVAVMHSDEDRITPGNAVAVQGDKPFRGLSRYGTGFLSRFQCSECDAELLKQVTFIDTPGVLSGEKQRIGRSYDFENVVEWFANRADMILLLFDAHKLDISDEFNRVIHSLRGNDDKVRVLLNKADMVDPQQLLRVYGALMWSLGRVIQTPEVVRVYVGSFREDEYVNKDNLKLFQKEQEDLLKDLKSLPRNSAMRKVNELVKRARLAKVHALIMCHLRGEMPALFGKDSKQKELVENLEREFFAVKKQFHLPRGDFPDLEKFREVLKQFEIAKFAKRNQRLIDAIDTVLEVDIPRLMQMFPQETSQPKFEKSTSDWLVSDGQKCAFDEIFARLKPVNGIASGDSVKGYMAESKLPFDKLGKIWSLADIDCDGAMDSEEFAVAQYLIIQTLAGDPLPPALPDKLVPPSKRGAPASAGESSAAAEEEVHDAI